MPTEIILRKLYNSLVPVDEIQAELLEELQPNGEYKAVLSQPRNILFHRKAFALAKIGYDAWEPPEDRQYKGKPIEKNFESFREELTIRAGFFDTFWTIDGKMRLKAKSWSFGKMNQEDFEKMYSAMINVLLNDILTNYTKDDLEEQVEHIMRFS